jgi:hypothetical protein
MFVEGVQEVANEVFFHRFWSVLSGK